MPKEKIMTRTYARGGNVNACIELPRRTPNTAYDKEIGGDNSVELKDIPEERKKDLEYMREEFVVIMCGKKLMKGNKWN